MEVECTAGSEVVLLPSPIGDWSSLVPHNLEESGTLLANAGTMSASLESAMPVPIYRMMSSTVVCVQGHRHRSAFEDPLLRNMNSSAAAAGPSAGMVPRGYDGFALEASSSMNFTLASDLLGMPSLPGDYNTKASPDPDSISRCIPDDYEMSHPSSQHPATGLPIPWV